MMKTILGLTLALGAITTTAAPVQAAECSEQYVKCLNDTWYYEGAAQDLADLECRAAYLGCVTRSLFTI